MKVGIDRALDAIRAKQANIKEPYDRYGIPWGCYDYRDSVAAGNSTLDYGRYQGLEMAAEIIIRHQEGELE